MAFPPRSRLLPYLLVLVICSAATTSASAQDRIALPRPAEEIQVRLTERTLLDGNQVHIESMKDVPAERLILPAIDLSEARFLTVFYSRDVADDYQLSVLVLPDTSGEVLYIDFNNDEDLTNDGAPHFFSRDDDEFVFWIEASHDKEQRTGRVLQRIPRSIRDNPELTDWFRNMHDEEGNLKPRLANLYNFEGTKGTFYFDDRLSLSRGELVLDSASYAIGIYDYTENGRFDDEDDLLLVDLTGEGSLEIINEEQEVFKLTEVFEVNGTRYRLTYVDPYGRGIRLVEVDEEPTQIYLQELQRRLAQAVVPVREGLALDSTFWNLELTTLSGTSLELESYRGQYVLLNVWGEWCSPCLAELPLLKKVLKGRPSGQLRMIGLVQTSNVEAARAVLEDVGINWPQVELPDTLRAQFKIWRYPTNILIQPDGKTYLEAGGVNARFFEDHVR